MSGRAPVRIGLWDDLIANVVYTGGRDKPKRRQFDERCGSSSAEQSGFGGVVQAEMPWKLDVTSEDQAVFLRRDFNDRKWAIALRAISVRDFQNNCDRYAKRKG